MVRFLVPAPASRFGPAMASARSQLPRNSSARTLLAFLRQEHLATRNFEICLEASKATIASMSASAKRRLRKRLQRQDHRPAPLHTLYPVCLTRRERTGGDQPLPLYPVLLSWRRWQMMRRQGKAGDDAIEDMLGPIAESSARAACQVQLHEPYESNERLAGHAHLVPHIHTEMLTGILAMIKEHLLLLRRLTTST